MVCLKCSKFYKPKKNGVVVEEMMPMGPREGHDNPENWKPYKAWMADLYECPNCQDVIIGGFSLGGPFAEHYQPDYEERKEGAAVRTGHNVIQVRDCGPTHLGWRPDENLNKLRLTRAQLGRMARQLNSTTDLINAALSDIDSSQASIDLMIEKYDGQEERPDPVIQDDLHDRIL